MEMRFLLVALAILPVWSQTSDWQSGVAQVLAEGKSPGSGFVVAVRSGRAYIVTCAHVVEGDPRKVEATNRHPARHRDGSALSKNLDWTLLPEHIRRLESRRGTLRACATSEAQRQ
jgi:hypothetical protein